MSEERGKMMPRFSARIGFYFWPVPNVMIMTEDGQVMETRGPNPVMIITEEGQVMETIPGFSR